MTPRHLYDAEGYWIAFVVGSDVFLRGGEWLGQLMEKSEIRDREEGLIGLVDEGDCLFILEKGPSRMAVSENVSS